MADRRQLDMFTRLHALRIAQRDAAEAELLLAGEAERAARETREQRDAAVVAAIGEWEAQLSGEFDPALSQLHARELAACVARRDQAVCAQEQAEEGTESARRVLGEQEMLRHQSEAQAKQARRKWLRDQQERELNDRADRISFIWSRP